MAGAARAMIQARHRAAAALTALLNIQHHSSEKVERSSKCDFNFSSPQPFQRLSQRSDSNDNGDDNHHFQPWRPSPMSPNSASLLHRYSRDNNDNNKKKRQNNSDDLPMNKKYTIEWHNVLGEGAYGKVHPARVAATGEKVALKKISKRFTNSSAFSNETAALWRVYDNGGHPNISGLRDIYEDYSHFYVILDLARGGELFDHLIKDGQYSEMDAARLATEILSALAFLHNIGVTHCDLKPENILLCSGRRGGETVKLIDFGCAIVDKRGDDDLPFQSSQSNNATKSIGTRAYWPPECFGKKSKKTDAMDMWSVGVILFIMLVGKHPFDIKGIKTDAEIEETIKSNPHPPMHLTTHLSPSARDFMRKLMEPNPDERLTAITALVRRSFHLSIFL
jgi:serine/threonine protein kinase